MKRFLRPLKNAACKTPGLGLLIERMLIWQRYRTERSLLNAAHHTTNIHPSILHFTINKAASQHVLQVLSLCGASLGMTTARFHEYAFHTDFPLLAHLPAAEFQKYAHVFKPAGYIYSAFNGVIAGIPDMNKYKIVLMLRDPRDALVSSYFSYAFSHEPPARCSPGYENFMQVRDKLRKMTLDEYVRHRCEPETLVYRRYHAQLLQQYPGAVYYTKYEDMTEDYPRWLQSLLEHLELKISTALFDRLLLDNERARPASENIHKHRRRGQPGEHREKLSAATVAYMNDAMRDILPAFGYAA